MFANLVASKAAHAIELYAKCMRAELDAAKTSQEMREQLAVMLDNACIRYQQAKGNDETTVLVMQMIRPRVKQWLTG